MKIEQILIITIIILVVGGVLWVNKKDENDKNNINHNLYEEPNTKMRFILIKSKENPFYISQYEVTNAQYKIFNPKHTKEDKQPVVNVSWKEANDFAKWLSSLHSNKKKFRLPTKTQFEYSARAGTKTSRFWGDDINDTCKYANVSQRDKICEDNYKKTAPVGSFKPNNFKLHDMLGNVSEWTQDKFHNDSINRIHCGGSFINVPKRIKSACEDHHDPNTGLYYIGFRLVLEVN